MNRKNKISTGNFLHSLITLLMMGWMGNAWAQGTVTFDYSQAHVNGKTEAYKNAESMPISTISNASTFTVPTNYTIFKNIDVNGNETDKGYTLKYWVDKEDNQAIYELGKTYPITKDLTLVPLFEPNPTTQINRITNPTIRYDFGRKVHEYVDPDAPDSQNPRMVCAQAVNIGSNQKPFWTAQVFVTTLQGGTEHQYWRDVAMWCDTGKKGYIKNTNQEEWTAFGPGTTFWVAAGAGTRISMMTYSPITSTTIDGVVPTLDEARTKAEREKAGDTHRYVYAYTTQNPELRIPIVIGDDYSYYQWIELATLAANKMNLKVKVDAEEHGKITSVTANSQYGATKNEDGSYNIRQGDQVKIQFERLFGYELDKIVDLEQKDEEGNPKVILQVNKDGTYTSTEEMTLKTTKPTAAGKRTQYEVDFSITAHRNLEICFKEKPTYYITYKGGPNATGAAPKAAWVEEGDYFTIPKNQTLYYEGYTLDYWKPEISSDAKETTEYKIGNTYPAEAKDLVLYPVFKPNEFNIFDIDKETTATWHFARKYGAPDIDYQKVNGILVTQVENNGKKIDLKLDLIGKKGKFNNLSKDSRIQINKGSVIDFPATPNCKVKLTATETPTSVTIADKKQGDNGYIEGDKYIEVTSVQGASHEAIFTGDKIYAIDFIITYQNQPDATERTTLQSLTCKGVTLTAEEIADQMNKNKYITFNVDVWNTKENKEVVPELSGKASAKGTVSVTKKPTLTDPNAIITVTTTGGITVATYPVKLIYQKPSVELEFTGYKIGNLEYKDKTSEVWDAPESGSVTLSFNHTMEEAKLEYYGKKNQSKAGTQMVFKYWDLTPGDTYTFEIPANKLTDIYGTPYSSELSLTLHIKAKESGYQHKKFDYVVTKDGDIDAAIAAANEKTDDKRFYIFVPDGEYHIGSKNTNEKTETLKTNNISLIGQSQEGVTIWNKPTEGGLKKTATLHLYKTATDFYAQDLKLENRFDYAKKAGQAAAFHDQGNRTIMKNVSLISYQDTYCSENAGADSRAYFENCDIAGVMDLICGDGNIWFEKCNIIHRDRSGNNIVAAEQGEIQEWGYVFNNCTIKTETENPQLHKDFNWTLARPWNNSPACTFLNTTMETLPKLTGWGRMETGKTIRFHEYRSMDADGKLIPLSTRSLTACAPGAGSEECVISEQEAETYTKRNALGGSDGFEPDELCAQINAQSGIIAGGEAAENQIEWKDDIELEDNLLKWNQKDEALCYFLFKKDSGKWIYLENTIDNQVNLNEYGTGSYCVRAANQRGGLGGATKTIEYVVADPYTLDIKKVEGYKEGDVDYGWTTICLPFNAKVPEKVKVYAATAHDKDDAESKITDFTMTLTPVTVIDANKGYVVYGPVGPHDFLPTSRNCDKVTILKGNPGREAIDKNNNNGYVLSYKNTWGLGFYKYTGSTLAGNRAWLPKEMVSDGNQERLSLGKRGITFTFAKGATPVLLPQMEKEGKDEPIYNLQGQNVDKSSAHHGIFITRRKGKFYRK